MEALIHALQKIWPHLVDISSTNGPMQTGQLNVGSFGGGGGGATATNVTLGSLSPWISYQGTSLVRGKKNLC